MVAATPAQLYAPANVRTASIQTTAPVIASRIPVQAFQQVCVFGSCLSHLILSSFQNMVQPSTERVAEYYVENSSQPVKVCLKKKLLLQHILYFQAAAFAGAGFVLAGAALAAARSLLAPV